MPQVGGIMAQSIPARFVNAVAQRKLDFESAGTALMPLICCGEARAEWLW